MYYIITVITLMLVIAVSLHRQYRQWHQLKEARLLADSLMRDYIEQYNAADRWHRRARSSRDRVNQLWRELNGANRTIVNLTASVEALSDQLDEHTIAYAKKVLGGTVTGRTYLNQPQLQAQSNLEKVVDKLAGYSAGPDWSKNQADIDKFYAGEPLSNADYLAKHGHWIDGLGYVEWVEGVGYQSLPNQPGLVQRKDGTPHIAGPLCKNFGCKPVSPFTADTDDDVEVPIDYYVVDRGE